MATGWWAETFAALAATAQIAHAALTGGQSYSGSLAATAQHATSELAGNQPFTATVDATAQRATSALTGVMAPAGAIASTAQRATSALAGAQTQSGVMASTAQRATSVLIEAHFSDDFNRANGSLGNDWVNRQGTMAISSNAAVPASTNLVVASHVTQATADDMEISVTLGTAVGSGDRIGVVLGSDNNGQAVWALWGAGSLVIYTVQTWAAGTPVARDTDAVTLVAGDKLTLRRVGNVYTTYKNDVIIAGSTWTDSGDVIPRDASHRYVGLIVDGQPSLSNYTPADSWSGRMLVTSSLGVQSTAQKATAALTGEQAQSGTMGATAQKATSSLTGTQTSLAHYSDNFNRADAANLGGSWTARSNNLKIVSNVAVPDTLSAFCLDSYNSDMVTDNHKVAATINAAPGTELLLLYVRSNNTDSQIYAYCLTGSQWVIYSKATSYADSLSSPTQRAITAGAVSFTAADVISFEVTGTGASAVYTVKKNGSSVGLSFTDSGSAIPSGATHRGWAIGYYATATGHGIDSVAADDI